MSIEKISKYLGWLPAPVARYFEKKMKQMPAAQKMISKENEKIAAELEKTLKPYRGKLAEYRELPTEGVKRESVMADVIQLHDWEKERWQDGYVSGGIYHGDADYIKFLNEVYAYQSQSNSLHSDLFPSAAKFESEVVSMVANMLGKGRTTDGDEVVGCMTSGGTESILMAMKVYRDRAKEEKGITAPEMILATTAHTAFDKAAHYFGIKQIRIPLNEDFTIQVEEVKKAINKNTIVIIGSAPAFPHGLFDDVEALSNIAYTNGIGFHVDACLGGFVFPFAEKLGYKVPIADFRLRGVTSISVDTHKYGYAAKGTSVILYRNATWRHYQYYTCTDWPGGMYFSPTITGSRPGALIAVSWAALVSIGEKGYLENTRKILETATTIREAIQQIPDLKLIGNPMWIIAVGSDSLNIYNVLQEMSKRHWNLNGLYKPACFHIAITLRHTQPGVAERFIQDLKESVAFVKDNPHVSEGLAPVYGMAASIPFRGMVSDMLKGYLDILYKV